MYSRETVDETFRLKARGWSDQAIAARCGVSVQALRHWRYGTRRGTATEARRTDPTTYCPECYPKASVHHEAYAYVLGAYLGDGHISEGRRGVHALSIFYDNRYPQLISYCRAAVEAVFPVKVFLVGRTGCSEIKAYSKHWPCVFPQHGKGHKHSRPIELESWQAEIVNAQPEAFIRGLIRSDGCRVVNRIRRKLPNGDGTHYEYPRYHFTNASTDIIGLLTGTLDLLAIAWKSHVIKNEPRYRDATVVSVSRRDAVARMDSFVGTKY